MNQLEHRHVPTRVHGSTVHTAPHKREEPHQQNCTPHTQHAMDTAQAVKWLWEQRKRIMEKVQASNGFSGGGNTAPSEEILKKALLDMFMKPEREGPKRPASPRSSIEGAAKEKRRRTPEEPRFAPPRGAQRPCMESGGEPAQKREREREEETFVDDSWRIMNEPETARGECLDEALPERVYEEAERVEDGEWGLESPREASWEIDDPRWDVLPTSSGVH